MAEGKEFESVRFLPQKREILQGSNISIRIQDITQNVAASFSFCNGILNEEHPTPLLPA